MTTLLLMPYFCGEMWLDPFKKLLSEAALTEEERERVKRALSLRLNSAGYDPWGLDPSTLLAAVGASKWFYRNYFRVETRGIERVPRGRCLLVANHGGQLPFDGYLVGLSMLLEAEPPRVARGMVERWAPSVPFVSTLFQRLGQITGDQRNCRALLESEETVLVFPEGAAGSGKTIFEAYQLRKFGTGFLRLALETRSPIVPVAVIGCEEAIPSIHNMKSIAKLVGAPYLPLTPFFPLLGPFGLIPLPSRVTLRFGEPLNFDGDPDMPDSEVEKRVDRVRESLSNEIREGLLERGDRIFT